MIKDERFASIVTMRGPVVIAKKACKKKRNRFARVDSDDDDDSDSDDENSSRLVDVNPGDLARAVKVLVSVAVESLQTDDPMSLLPFLLRQRSRL